MSGVMIAAWLDVRSKPLRTLAAVAGMVAAVVAVIVVDAASLLSRNANSEFIATNFGRNATVEVSPMSEARNRPPVLEGGDQPQQGGRAPVPDLVRANGVELISSRVDAEMIVTHDDRVVSTGAVWVSSTYARVSIVPLVAGSMPMVTATSDVPHAIITRRLAQQLGFDGEDALGQRILYVAGPNLPNNDIKSIPLRWMVVDGIAQTLGPLDELMDVLLVSDLSRPELLAEYSTESWIMHINPDDFAFFWELIQTSGPVTANGEPVYTAVRIDRSDELDPIFSQQRITAAAVTLISLLVGGLGILGVGLASVRERAREFGLRRALGASTSNIFVGVITQTLLEVLLAALIAIPLATILVELFARQLVLPSLPLPASTSLPIRSAILGLASALAVGLVAGLMPAIRAARASVVQALRG